MVKYVIQTFILKACNRTSDNFWGLGDMIRGTIQLYQLSKKYNFELIVDTQLHPISNFLINKEHPFKDLIQNNKNKISFIEESEKYILLHRKKNNPMTTLSFFTNDKFNSPITEDCKEFIKSLFIPNSEFMKYILNHVEKIPYVSYSILHFRLGDSELVINNKNNTNNIKEFNNRLQSIIKTVQNQQNIDNKLILFSDSLKLKNIVKTNSDVFMFDFKPSHIGCSNSNDIRDTLVEFFIIINSKSIKTYSIYPWTSGFVKIINDIFNVPLETLKLL
jgi:hypothetical protein